MCVLWWQSWNVKDLSPLNPLAVVSMQLAPPEDWQTVWTQTRGLSQYTQLFWLQWYARPDLRKQLLENLRQFPIYRSPMKVVVHPDTIAEWSDLPRWADRRLRQREWDIRKSVIAGYSLTVEQCQQLHPDARKML